MRYLGILAALLLVSASGLVCAGSAPLSTDGWTLTPVICGSTIQLVLGIDNGAGLADYTGTMSKTWGDPTLSDPTQFIALGDSGAVLKALTVTLDGDPQISVKFSVAAGSTDQHFEVSPASPLSFTTMSNAKGTATSAITVTDLDGNGASASGSLINDCFYRAVCNEGSTPMDLCYLIPGTVTATPYSSNVSSANMPPWQAINGPISDIWAEFSFSLSANDSASGTSSFTILAVPEPGSVLAMLMGLIGMTGFVARRKRA